MLTIRPEQMRILGEAARNEFEQRLKRHLDRKFGVDLAEGELRAAVPEAAEFGIRRERDVVRLCELMFGETGILSASVFDRACQNILLAYGVPAEDKLTQLEHRLKGSRPQVDG